MCPFKNTNLIIAGLVAIIISVIAILGVVKKAGGRNEDTVD